MIIGLFGASGFDRALYATMIQYLTSGSSKFDESGNIKRTFQQFIEKGGGYSPRNFDHHYQSDFELKSFSDKPLNILASVLGCNRSKFLLPQFMATPLDKKWDVYVHDNGKICGEKKYEKLNELQRSWWSHHTVTPEYLLKQIISNQEKIHPLFWILALFSDYYDGRIGYETDRSSNWIILDVETEIQKQAISDRDGLLIDLEQVKNFDNQDHDSALSILRQLLLNYKIIS